MFDNAFNDYFDKLYSFIDSNQELICILKKKKNLYQISNKFELRDKTLKLSEILSEI
jgi:hypothetical protein